ncbi:F-box protein At5g50450 [Euphorbia lathyris]|uniref:F-box protein At5g50450 n=1 Tax=Euphorbia lathyris TaxID=212925 RepID=UPI003313C85C
MPTRKKLKGSHNFFQFSNLFDQLPDDLVVCILCKLTSSASSPSDFINILFTCKRLNRLALHPLVLSKAGPKTLAIKSKNWSDDAHRFLKQCVAAGNTEASYTLGMIRFYCLQNRRSGASLMAKAAVKSHALALYSLAIMQFNGSGGSKSDKDLRAGVALCARAAVLGHIDALRELGHCLQDGYGVTQNISEGRRLLIQANARELACSLRSILTGRPQHRHQKQNLQYASCATPTVGDKECPLLSDFGCNVPAREVHPANQFLREWFESGRGVLEPNLRLCSHSGCGRPETRPHEFRRCSVCGNVNYCSRGCQALDWKLRHKAECVATEQWHGLHGGGDNEIGGMVEIEGDNVAIVH